MHHRFEAVARPLFATVLVAVVALCTSCGSTAAYYEDAGEQPRVVVDDHPEVVRQQGWLVFQDLSLKTAAEGGAPESPHVAGQIMGGLFIGPFGPVVGASSEGRQGRILTRGWLQLATRAFYPATGEAPEPPYVPGWQDDENRGFYPSGEVVTTLSPPKAVDLP